MAVPLSGFSRPLGLDDSLLDDDAQARGLSAYVVGFESGRADVVHGARGAVGLSREADATPVEDEHVAQHVPVFAREERHEILLDVHGLGVLGPTEALGDAL